MRLTPIVATFATALSGLAQAQLEDTCGSDIDSFVWVFEDEIDIQVIWNRYQVVAAPTSAHAFLNGFDFFSKILTGDLSTVSSSCVGMPFSSASIITLTDVDSDDILITPVLAMVGAFAKDSRADADSTIAISNAHTEGRGGIIDRCQSWTNVRCEGWGVEDHNQFLGPIQTLARSVVVQDTGGPDPQDMIVQWTIRLVSGLDLNVDVLFCPPPGGLCFGPRVQDTPTVLFVSYSATAEYSDQSTETSTIQGMLILHPDASVSAMGIFTDPVFMAISDGNGGFDINGTLAGSMSFTAGVLTGMDDETISDSFQADTGDIDRDGITCWSDRAAFKDTFGAICGDSNYNPRGDFDLDGDVDGTDLTAFNLLFPPTDPSCPCLADLSGSIDPNSPDYGVPDGVIDSTDFNYFLTLFANGDPAADLSGSIDPNSVDYGVPDGNVDSVDFSFYLVLFGLGC